MNNFVIDANRLVNDLKGCIAQLKSIYFESKDPIDDNELVLQKLCVKLETALRHNMKDKFTLLGLRKDYWNLFAECLSKDEGTRYVNSLSQLRTFQGKGRALIRYCLVQKTLADTIQRVLMHKKRIEWYAPDALLVNNTLTAALIGKLYDLNELEFHLSCTGCDLDMSWPSFGRLYTDGYERRGRLNSASSVASTTDLANERSDPLIGLNAEISALRQMLTRELENEKGFTEDGIWEYSLSDDTSPSINELTLDISRLHQAFVKWKSLIDAKLFKADHELQRISDENGRLTESCDSQLRQLTEKHHNLSEIASKETALQINDLQSKLRTAEASICDLKSALEASRNELVKVSGQNKDYQMTLLNAEKESNASQGKVETLECEVLKLTGIVEIQNKECERLKEENRKIELKNKDLSDSEVMIRNQLEVSKSKLSIKTLEKDKLQEAFESVNGLVFASFEDFESYYKSRLLDKEKGLEVKESENKMLQEHLIQLNAENESLKTEVKKCVEKLRVSDVEILDSKLNSQTRLNEIRKNDAGSTTDIIENINCYLSTWLSTYFDTTPEENDPTGNLNKLDALLKNNKETLTCFSDERNRLDLECTAIRKENERLLQLNAEHEKETADSYQREKLELEEKCRMSLEEKSKLEETINCLHEEVEKLNKKVEEESYLKLVFESEVTEIGELLTTERKQREDALKTIEILKQKVEEAEIKLKDVEVARVQCQEELDLATSKLEFSGSKCESLEGDLEKSQNEMSNMKKQLTEYEEQLAGLKCTMEQQVSSLKFQLSSEALKYGEEIKTLSEEKSEAISLRNKIQENEETITELENKLKERNECWQVEKKKLTGDIKVLKHEIKVLNDQIDESKQEIQSMENTLMLSKKKCEKERSRNLEYKKTINEIRDQKSEHENILEQEKMELEEDIKQLKSKMISLLSDKSELWLKSNQLEYDMKTRLSDSWVDDKNVSRCPKCNVEFTLFVRKHHCRFCGNVFCHNCCDNYVKTIHSRKPYRACTSCFKKEKELKTETSPVNTSVDQDASDLSIDSRESDNEEKLTSTPKKAIKTTASHDKHSGNDSKNQKNDISYSSGDESDGNFQIIDENEVRDDYLNKFLQNDDENVRHRGVLRPGETGNEDWNEVIIPARKRYIVNVEAVAQSLLLLEFISSQKGILFGAAMEERESNSSVKTIVPLCQVNSRERSVRKHLTMSSSGILMLLFDNTHPKSSEQKLHFRIAPSESRLLK